MAKINGEQVLAELTERMGDKLQKDLIRFHLEPDRTADATVIGENFAASNIGLKCADDLDGLGEGEYPEGEIKSWIRDAKKAIKLCAKHRVSDTNRNVLLMLWHKSIK